MQTPRSVWVAIGVAALLPLLASAVVTNAPPTSVVSTSASPIDAVVALLVKLGGWFWGIILALAVVFIVYAAFLFLTSGGDEEKVKEAKNYIIYAVVALAVAILATGIVYLTQVFFTTPTGVLCGTVYCPPGQICNTWDWSCSPP
ncbi:MAG: pilin [Candidatus Jorgensenbacteria bacterium]